MKRVAGAALALLVATTARGDGDPAQPDETVTLPLTPPERPFLLVDAPRRFTSTEPAKVRLQLRYGGQAFVAVYRARDPHALAGVAGTRQGLAIAQSPLGLEAEGLLAGDVARGRALDLVSRGRVALPKPRQARNVADETEVYDSNEAQEDEIATYWVSTGDWSVREVDLGRLPPGLYLVRVLAGPYATSALLSVGELVLLARRGDTHDTVHVTDANGAPLSGIAVRAETDGHVVARAVTSESGSARIDASDAPVVRYVAERGTDFAWTDVTHARLDPCDPRVYLATGRPTYRTGEIVHVRGHVRGCDRQGRFVALANERVLLEPNPEGTDPLEVRTDADGNFVARLDTGATLTATIRGERQERTIRIDHRSLPVRGITVSVDRPVAVSGQTIRVTVADDDGGWPRARSVTLDTPAGRLVESIGPGAPAVFHVPVPPQGEPIERWTLTASLADAHRVTIAATEVWVGRTSTLLSVDAPERGTSGRNTRITVRATDLLGAATSGAARVTVHASDGNRPLGAALFTTRAEVPASGRRTLDVPLTGNGPWWIAAKRGDASAEAIVWAAERPPSLAARGPLAVMPATDRIAPGQRLAIDVRMPRGAGASWVTLEQGSVWTERSLDAAPGQTVRVTLPVPSRARGLAKVVVAHVARGTVTTASATIDVATSGEIELAAETDRRVYAQGERARVTLLATKPDGSPSDGVATVWLADAGYWEMGEETYPLPGAYLALPGRMATGGDSTAPIAFGAEEGRVFPDARIEWNGRLVPGTTHRHGWGHYARVIRVTRQGDTLEIARDIAREAGLAGARACTERVREVGTAHFLARDLPWDLVAIKLAELTQTEPFVRNRVLHFACPGAGIGLGSIGGLGHGSGAGGGGMGLAGRGGPTREERLYGTLAFIGLARLGPDGRVELELDLPDHPGRWRVESLVIADDGGGDRAHAIVHTQRPLELWSDTPPRLAPGDEAAMAIHVRAPSLAGQTVTLDVEPSARLSLATAPPRTVTLDARGEATADLRVALARTNARGPTSSEADIVVRAQAGAHRDDVRARVIAVPSHTVQPVAMRALVGPEPTDVHVPLPSLAAPASLAISIDSGLAESIDDVLDGLMEPRWHIAAMRVDRMASMRALLDAASRLPDADAQTLRARIEHAIASEAEGLHRLASSSGGLSWWSGLPDSGRVTAEALSALDDLALNDDRWEPAWDSLRRQARADALSGEAAAIAALVLARSEGEGDRELSRALLDEAASGDPTDLARLTFALRAAHALAESDRSERASAPDGRAHAASTNAGASSARADMLAAPAPRRGRPARPTVRSLARDLRSALRARVADGGEPGPCRGPIWFLCYERWGERGDVARAAAALLDTNGDARTEAAAALRWLSRRPPAENQWFWGSAEADVLALASRVMPHRDDGRPQYRVLVDGRPVSLRAGRVQLASGARDVRIAFTGRSDRLLRVRVDGVVETPEPTRHAGNASLTRAFAHAGGTWRVDLSFTTPATARDVELAVPLPSGLELAGEAQAPDGSHMTIVDGTVHLRWPRSPGATRVTLPLIALAEGTFAAPSARLRDATGTSWSLTAATTTRVVR